MSKSSKARRTQPKGGRVYQLFLDQVLADPIMEQARLTSLTPVLVIQMATEIALGLREPSAEWKEAVEIRKGTWRGQKIHTEAELSKTDFPYPPEPEEV